ncbi:MAG: hypothetical protein IPM94_14210 [bacterium]|nr:hypothetical protein [bacterium]
MHWQKLLQHAVAHVVAEQGAGLEAFLEFLDPEPASAADVAVLRVGHFHLLFVCQGCAVRSRREAGQARHQPAEIPAFGCCRRRGAIRGRARRVGP